MEALSVILDLEQSGFRDEEYGVIEHGAEMVIGGMPRGTASGKPTVMIGLEIPQGFLVAETTLALFLTAADSLKAKYGDPRT